MTGDELKIARTLLGLSARKLAQRLGLEGMWADRTVRAWERGEFKSGVPDHVADSVRQFLREDRKASAFARAVKK